MDSNLQMDELVKLLDCGWLEESDKEILKDSIRKMIRILPKITEQMEKMFEDD